MTMDITWAPEPLSDEAKRCGVKPFDYRAKAGPLTLRAYEYFASARWEAAVYNEALGLAIGGTFQYPLASENGLPDLASAQSKAECFAREIAMHPGAMT